MLSIYDGRTCIGFVLCRGKLGFEAFDAEGKSRGFHKIQLDAALASLSGTLGNLVYKHYRNDKRGHVISRKPDMSRVKWSPAQRAHRQRMKAAAAFHRQVLADPALLKKYTAHAKKNRVNLSAVTMGEVLRKKSA